MDPEDRGPMQKHEAPKPTYHWLEKKRGDTAQRIVKLLALAALVLIALWFLGWRPFGGGWRP